MMSIENCVTRRELLEDVESWKERYPEMPTVEAARQQKDPVLWIKAREDLVGSELGRFAFFVAGYVTGGVPTFAFPSGGSFAMMSVGQFMRGGATRLFGLMVLHDSREMAWDELDDERLEYEGPGELCFVVDESWQPKPFSEVVKDYPDYKPVPETFRAGFKRLHFLKYTRIPDGLGVAPCGLVLFEESDIRSARGEYRRKLAVVVDEPRRGIVIDVAEFCGDEAARAVSAFWDDGYEAEFREALERWRYGQPTRMRFEPVRMIRQLSRDLYEALVLDIWPSPAAVTDFGIASEAHYGALQEAVRVHGVTLEQLDRALGRGAALTKLIGPENRYHGVVFTTPWDELMPSFEELDRLSEEEFEGLEESIKLRYFYELEDREAEGKLPS